MLIKIQALTTVIKLPQYYEKNKFDYWNTASYCLHTTQ